MKINQIPKEEPRIDLEALPHENVLIAVEERMKEATENKTGGLIIDFKQLDGKKFSMKYGKVAGAMLIEALQKLGYNDTEELAKSYHKYTLLSGRTGYARYIPTEIYK